MEYAPFADGEEIPSELFGNPEHAGRLKESMLSRSEPPCRFFFIINSVSGQIGLEVTPEEYIGKLVAVFHEVRRVLRDDGTL